MENDRIVKGIWIPIEIWKDKNLTWNEKILLLEIDSYTSNDKDCFISNEFISELLGISETNASKAISSLIKKGYIVKTRFDGRKRYVKSALSITTTLHCQEQQPSHAHENVNINNKQLLSTNTITDKEKVDKKKSLDLSAVSAEMLPIVEDWLEYKKEKKQSYKQKGFTTFYNNLIKYSENNPVIARAIVDKSMGNNWDGAFPLKEDELKLIQTPTQELTLREKCDRFLAWLCKRRGEKAMMAYNISINDFSEMYRHYNDSAKLCEAVMELTKQPIMPNEKLIDLFRRQQKGE